MLPSGITFSGPAIDDPGLLDDLPAELRLLLQERNGFIIHHGALHVRGVCVDPQWHSLRQTWKGKNSFQQLYPVVLPTDIPFAQDCVGDQFLLRNGEVWRLLAETGEAEQVSPNLQTFFSEVEKDPEEFLNFSPKMKLEPGQLIHAYPPFCVKESGKGTSLRPCPAHEVILFHAELAQQISKIPDGDQLRIQIVDDREPKK